VTWPAGAPQVVHDEVVGSGGGDRPGQFVARAVDPDRGLGAALHEPVEDALVAPGDDDPRARAVRELRGDPS
jgi:hypothetical protein